MFEGHFTGKLINAKGLRDEDFSKAIREKRLDALLASLPVDQVVRCHNRIFDNMAGYILSKLFQTGNPGWPYYVTDEGPPAALAFVCLLNITSETTDYKEDWGVQCYYNYDETDGISNVGDSVGGAGNYSAKRFEEDQITAWEIAKDTSGRESIYFRNRLLWLPSHAVSSSINSLGIFFCSDGDDDNLGYYACIGRIGRVRFRDNAGTPVTLNKTSNQVFLVEYTFSLVSQ